MYAGYSRQGQYAVAIGFEAGETSQGNRNVAIGYQAGNYQVYNALETGFGADAIAIGTFAGWQEQSSTSIAIGYAAGKTSQGQSIAIGINAGETNQDDLAIAIGTDAGSTNQGAGAIAIGNGAGQTNQAPYSIAIGAGANQSTGSVVISGGNTGITAINTGTFIQPIRPISGQGSNYVGTILTYNANSKEVTQGMPRLPCYSNDTAANTAVGTPLKGHMYFDYTLNKAKVYNGTAWAAMN